MTIQDLGSIGELAAAVATIITLVYLAIQIRANTTALRSEARGRSHEQAHSTASIIGSSTETADVYSRGLADFESLSPAEQVQFQFLFSMLLNQADAAHSDFELGLGDQGWMDSNLRGVLRLLRTPGGQAYWRLNSSTFAPRFQTHINKRLQAPPEDSPAAQQSAAADSA